MTNSITFKTCNLDDAPRIGISPFTGENVEFPNDPGFSDAERHAVSALLKRYSPELRAGDSQDLTLSDGTTVSIWTGDLDAENAGKYFSLEFDGPATDATIAFAYELAQTGNLSIGNLNDKNVALVNEPHSLLVRKRWPNAPVLKSTKELAKWIRDHLGIQLTH